MLSLTTTEALLRSAHLLAGKGIGGPGWTRAIRLRDAAIIEVLVSTGVRSEEVVRLNAEDVDLERQTLYIRGKACRERALYLSCEESIETLRAHLANRAQLHPTSDAFFPNRWGDHLNAQSVPAHQGDSRRR